MAYKYSNSQKLYYVSFPTSEYLFIKKEFPNLFKFLNQHVSVGKQDITLTLTYDEKEHMLDEVMFEAAGRVGLVYGKVDMLPEGIKLENIFGYAGMWEHPEAID